MKQLIRQIQLIQDRKITPCSILIHDGYIECLLDYDASEIHYNIDKIIQGNGIYASHGFVDIHTHGGGGYDFMDGTIEAYQGAIAFHVKHGTTAITPTTLASTKEELLKTFSVYRQVSSKPEGAALIGFHIEGPYLSPMQSGAQDLKYIRNPLPEEYLEIVEKGQDIILRWTIAPEVEGAYELGDYLLSKGIVPTAGHTNATFDQMIEAIGHGFAHITHLYSCTSTIKRENGYRIAGVTESPYVSDKITVEIIADGKHLPKSILQMVYKNIGADRIALVTDSMRGAGMTEGKSILGSSELGQEVVIEDGVAKMPDRKAFAGSIATADLLVRNMIGLAGASLPDAVMMMTQTPAKIIGRQHSIGTVKPGRRADIILFDKGIKIKKTIIAGEEIWKEE